MAAIRESSGEVVSVGLCTSTPRWEEAVHDRDSHIITVSSRGLMESESAMLLFQVSWFTLGSDCGPTWPCAGCSTMLVVVEVSVGACNHEFKLTTFREGGGVCNFVGTTCYFTAYQG